jgi:hypothetical protein
MKKGTYLVGMTPIEFNLYRLKTLKKSYLIFAPLKLWVFQFYLHGEPTKAPSLLVGKDIIN